jgi:hypothetical protein
MKKCLILSFIVLAFSFSARSQVIDTTIQSILAFKVTPVKINIKDSILTNRVGLRGLVDDFQGSLTIYVQMMNSSEQTLNGVTFNRIVTISTWNETLTGTDYADYDGSPQYLAGYLSRKYGLVF